jgi:hypothetical protein
MPQAALPLLDFVGLLAHSALQFRTDSVYCGTMLICWRRFNLYLLLAAGLALVCGCKTTGKGQLCTLRLHEEVHPDATGRSEEVTVHRDPVVLLNIDKAPFLNEGSVKQAKVIDVVGGFALSIQFDRQGSWLLEQKTADLRGRHLAIFSQFHQAPGDKLNGGRWLAAPKIMNHITDGLLTFTPDATRAEAEKIAQSLNNVAKRLETGKEVKF